ncbi:hypothetical protein HanXRQr2_Chr03g0099511 [Helianthus annuus]|uniref:Uncharacterized protein n=1 Tax=Helianthus annuus TaxID=4232 RepID=A0A9K3JDM8_HELAN|nr:hypothetical protein HanXRQr2_Chr03g0099511 [Helianthus annuus]
MSLVILITVEAEARLKIFTEEKRLSIGEEMYQFRRKVYPFEEKMYRFG